MKDLKERENEARAHLAERLSRIKEARRRQLAADNGPRRKAAPKPVVTDADVPVFWWNL